MPIEASAFQRFGKVGSTLWNKWWTIFLHMFCKHSLLKQPQIQPCLNSKVPSEDGAISPQKGSLQFQLRSHLIFHLCRTFLHMVDMLEMFDEVVEFEECEECLHALHRHQRNTNKLWYCKLIFGFLCTTILLQHWYFVTTCAPWPPRPKTLGSMLVL